MPYSDNIPITDSFAVMPSIDQSLGVRLRQQRTISGMTQAQLAKKLGVSAQQVQKYETGKNRLTVARMLELSQLLRISPLWFLQDLGHGTASSASHVATDAMHSAYTSLSRALFEAFNGLKQPDDRQLVVQLARRLNEG